MRGKMGHACLPALGQLKDSFTLPPCAFIYTGLKSDQMADFSIMIQCTVHEKTLRRKSGGHVTLEFLQLGGIIVLLQDIWAGQMLASWNKSFMTRSFYLFVLLLVFLGYVKFIFKVS